mmetsp:Transcript_87705/g.281567  ORF Transcript_87705/g.281567 Transcript_87705/m.281567 type:complete len:146 (+) Transcript_87705:266-703(+)
MAGHGSTPLAPVSVTLTTPRDWAEHAVRSSPTGTRRGPQAMIPETKKTGILMDKHFGTGRTGFLDRTSATYFSETMGSPKSRSAPVSPFGAQNRGHLSRSLSCAALGPALPAAGSETWRINRSTSEISLKPLYNPQKTPQQTALR